MSVLRPSNELPRKWSEEEITLGIAKVVASGLNETQIREAFVRVAQRRYPADVAAEFIEMHLPMILQRFRDLAAKQ